MRRIVFALLALLLFGGIAIPAAGAAELTTQQKFDVLRQKGIFSGFSDGSAGLYQSMTREQFAQVLYKLMELPPPSGSPTYSDVIRTRWSYTAVEAVTEAGLMVGNGARKFGPDSPVTVEQLAAVLVRSYGQSSGNLYVVGKVSAWARNSVGIALQNGWIPQMKDYTGPATRGLLVEAVYAVYMQMQGQQLRVSSVTAVGNQQVRVNLIQPVTTAEASRFKIRDVLGVELDVLGTLVNWDGLSVTVFTASQTANKAYSLYIDGVPWTFTGMSNDNVKPTITSFNRQVGGTLELVFSEPVDRASATNGSNYSINNGLKITGIKLSDDNRKVTITTAWQTEGTTYRLTVRDVKDLGGNEMNDWSSNFVSDNSVPKASFSFNDSTGRITVSFNERVHPDISVNLNRYSIDKGLSVIKAELDGDGKTVRLTTSPQKDATLYTLTVSGIPDMAGNSMETQYFQFGGVANPAQSIQLQSVNAANENTLEVTFNRAPSDNDIAKMGLGILTDNGNNVSMTGWQSYKSRKPGNDNKTVYVQFRTNNDSNPALFRPGHVYLSRVTGIDNLVTANNADRDSFAGTQARNPDPFVKDVVPISKNAVKILFSEPVRNVSEAAFIVREKEGDYVKIDDDALNNTNAVVTEVVLKFDGNLESGHLYVMTFRSGTVKDAAGWNGIQTKNGSDDFAVSFRGV
ncbi:Ig-like domain-containing protein [Cohnella candidum]|nr:Ig-like domain-containing protein [Cohnella candidum]